MNIAAINTCRGAPEEALNKAAAPETRSLLERVRSAVTQIFSVITTTALFFLSPTLFVAGTLLTIWNVEKSQSLMDRVEMVWDRQVWQIKALLVAGALTALPVAVSALAIFEGAKFGHFLSQRT